MLFAQLRATAEQLDHAPVFGRRLRGAAAAAEKTETLQSFHIPLVGAGGWA